jgi:hypothetical protein
VPGKPNPNGFEFMGLVDDNKFMWMLIWEKPHQDDKQGRPAAMLDLVKLILEKLKKFNQPFILYLDSRFSSIEALELVVNAGMFMVGSNSITRRPTKLWPYLREGLEKREWRTVYWPKYKSIACVVRAKNKSFVNLISNCVGASPHIVSHIRRKYPRTSYRIVSPEVQKEYNLHKNNVDVYNRMLLAYRQQTNYVSEDQALLHFFLNATVLNAYAWYKGTSTTTQLEFRLNLLAQLRAKYCPQKPHPQVSNNHIARPLKGDEKALRKCPTVGCQCHPWRFCVACDRPMCSQCYDRVHQMMF